HGLRPAFPTRRSSDLGTALPTVAFIGVWKDVGIYMIYWLAALQSVPRDVVEAAEIDGANKWKVFWKITVPIILPIAGVITLLAVDRKSTRLNSSHVSI